MPEDVHPRLARSSAELYHYFTFGMALNYRRNSYALWQSMTTTFDDPQARVVLDPVAVTRLHPRVVRAFLCRHRVALQQERQSAAWIKIARTVVDEYDGDVRNLFVSCNRDVDVLRGRVQKSRARDFPYLRGNKIFNYWLFVLNQYTDVQLRNKSSLTIAPDTHVMKASVRLGVIAENVLTTASAQHTVATAWRNILFGTGIDPIDIHTPLWLWSRAGFPAVA